jgi:hypothetical protein
MWFRGLDRRRRATRAIALGPAVSWTSVERSTCGSFLVTLHLLVVPVHLAFLFRRADQILVVVVVDALFNL